VCRGRHCAGGQERARWLPGQGSRTRKTVGSVRRHWQERIPPRQNIAETGGNRRPRPELARDEAPPVAKHSPSEAFVVA